MANPTPTPRSFAYLRVSTGSQEASLDSQLALANTVALDLETTGVRMGKVFSEVESASEVVYSKRPAFVALMGELRKGDHLIVYAQDRLDRDPIEALNCLKFLAGLNITLHTTRDGQAGPVLATLQDIMMRMFGALHAAMESDLISKRVTAAHAYRKANGLAYNHCPFGHKTIKVPKQPGQQGNYKKWVWDIHQCEILREIKRRRDEGETWKSIGQDLDRRGLRSPNGTRWWKPAKKNRGGSFGSLWRAHQWHLKLLASGRDLGDIPVIPDAPVVGLEEASPERNPE